MIQIRANSKPVQLHNEGLVVFLYDKANGKKIQHFDPHLLGGFSDRDANDPRLAVLAKKGLLVAYELEQDDELAIEVATGAPLTDEELKAGRWHAVQRAPISLPSGKLCIEGYNNLRISPDYDPDEDPGAIVSVSAGDYVISLYRTDWNALEQDGLCDDNQEWKGPAQVLVLTPASEAETVASPEPMLRFALTG